MSAPPCVLLPWDTDFFQFRVGRVEGDVLRNESADEVDQWSRLHHIRCLYFLARIDDPLTTRVAEEHGFRLVDVRVTFERRAVPGDGWVDAKEAGSAVIREARSADLPALQALARTAHTDTRFFNDPGFSREKAEALYSAWITREFQGKAQCVLVADSEAGQPCGYISCHLNPEQSTGQIGLVAVQREARRSGVGRKLVLTAFNWLAGQGAKAVSVVTQGRNGSALRLYERCGFLTRELQLWYHKWYPEPGASP